MPIVFDCPKCAAKMKIADSAGGTKTECPSCQATLTVPDLSPEEKAAALLARLLESSESIQVRLGWILAILALWFALACWIGFARLAEGRL